MEKNSEKHWKKPYDPSPEELKTACESIQKTWTEKERLRRIGFKDPEPYVIPTVPLSFSLYVEEWINQRYYSED